MIPIQEKWREYQLRISQEPDIRKKKELLKEYKRWKLDFKEITHTTKCEEASRHSKRNYYKTDTNYSKTLLHFVEQNKKHSTKAESMFYELLKSNHINFCYQFPFKFSNQSWRYILDFYFPKKKIAVEIDGGYHNTKEQMEKDRERDRHFRKIGINTIRLSNEEVISLNERVISIIEMLKQPKT